MYLLIKVDNIEAPLYHIHTETIHAAIVGRHCPVITGLGKTKQIAAGDLL